MASPVLTILGMRNFLHTNLFAFLLHLLSLLARKSLALLLFFCLVYTAVSAQTVVVWTGSVDNQWNNPFNWDDGVTPAPGDNVEIPSTINDPLLNSAITAVGNFKLSVGVSLNMNGKSLTIYGNAEIDGTLNNNSGGITFAGLGVQTIDGINPVIFNKLIVNQATPYSTLVLNQKVIVNNGGNVTFVNGRIVSSTGSLLVFNANATTNGASNNSFVSGPVEKLMDGKGFIFPIGKGCTYRGFGMTPVAANNYAYQAEYFQSSYNATTYLAPLRRVSNVEYWEVKQVSGGGDPTISNVALHWQDPAALPCRSNIADIQVSQFNKTAWETRGGNGGPAAGIGSVKSATALYPIGTAKAYFTFGSVSVLAAGACVIQYLPDPLTVSLSSSPNATLCLGQPITTTATATGATNYQFFVNTISVQNGAKNWYTTSALSEGTSQISVLATGPLVCENMATIDVIVNPLPIAPDITAGGPTILCQGSSVTLTSSASSGNQWVLDGTNLTLETNPAITVSAPGDYTVFYTDANGCTATSSPIKVTVNLPPTVTITGASTFCQGGNTLLTASAGSSYQWYLNSGLIVGATYASLAVDASGSYEVKVTDAQGCSAISAAVVVTSDPTIAPPKPTISGTLSFCQEANTVLSSSEATGNQWYLNGSAISGESNKNLTVTQAGDYSVMVTVGGCANMSASATVVATSPPVVTISGNTSFCQSGNTILTSSEATGNQWLFNKNPIVGEVGKTLKVTAAGDYSVAVTHLNSCTSFSAETKVTVNPLPIVSGTAALCTGGNTVLTSSETSGNQWYFNNISIIGETNPTVTVTAAGDYSVEFTDVTGCAVTSAAVKVAVNPLPVAPTISTSDPTTFCLGGYAKLTSSAATGNQWYWNGALMTGETNPTLTVTAAGDYTVSFTDANTCSATSLAITITVYFLPLEPTITADAASTFCLGGSVTLTSSEPTGNQWYWNGNLMAGRTKDTLVVTVDGDYSVSSTNVNSCSIFSSPTRVTVITVPVPVIAGFTTFCSGGTNLTSSSAGGNQWYFEGKAIAGASNATLVATVTGNYSVSVTDVNGCTSFSLPVSVIKKAAPTPPLIKASGPVSFCTGSSVLLTSSEATGNQWRINGGIIVGATSNTLTVTGNGNYTVEYTDLNGCFSTSAITKVSVNSLPQKPIITVAGSTVLCDGSTVTLSSTAEATYQWFQDGNPVTGGTNQTLSVSAPGNYVVRVTNIFGCSSTSGFTKIKFNPMPAKPTITAGKPIPFCQGGSVVLTSSLSVAGYQWFFNGNPITNETNQTFTASAAGSYSVTITDANGCTNTSDAFPVTINPLPIVNISGKTTFCIGGSTLLSSSAVAGNQWLLNNNPIPGAKGTSLVVNAIGDYSVKVTDANGCENTSATISITAASIIAPPKPIITPDDATTFCEGGSVTLRSSQGSGNQWYFNSSLIIGETKDFFSADAAGDYYVTFTDPSGCQSVSDMVSVIVNPLPTVTISGNPVFCPGGSVTLTSSEVSGNQWFFNGSAMAFETSQTLVTSMEGTYEVSFTDANSCSNVSASVVVTKNLVPTVSIGGSLSFCKGGNTLLTSSASTGNEWYLNGIKIPGATNPTLVVSVAGLYSVSFNDPNGCSATATPVNITENALPAVPTITAGGPTTFCAGGSVSLKSSAASGYQWLLNGNPIAGATASTFPASATGNYTVVVTNGATCANTSAITKVTLKPLPAKPTISTGGLPLSFCAGGSVVLSSSLATNYQWRLNGTPLAGKTASTLTVSVSGNYSVTTTDAATTCSNTSDLVKVTVNPLPNVTISGVDMFCEGESTELTSSEAAGNQWLLNGNAISGQNGTTLTVTVAGDYSVLVINANGCSATSTTTSVTENPLPDIPIITVVGSATFCAGGLVRLESSSASGNQWFLDGVFLSGENSDYLEATASGNYTVMVSDGNSCSSTSANTMVTVHPLPTIPTISASGPTTFCTGGSVTLTSSAASGNQWFVNGSPIINQTGPTLDVITDGDYEVEFTDGNSCSIKSAITQVIVNQPPTVPTISLGGPTTFCAGGSVTLTSSEASGNQWLLNGNPMNGQTGATVAATASGDYTVRFTSNGCSATSSITQVTVNQPAVPVLMASGSTTFCIGGSVTLRTSGGSTSQWILNGSLMNGKIGDSLVVSAGGDYSVLVKDNLGCTASSLPTKVTVNVLPAIPTITAVDPATFCQGGSVKLTSSVASSYQWLLNGNPINLENGQTITATTAGNYSVIAPNAGSCSVTSSTFLVTVNPLPTVSISGLSNVYCNTSAKVVMTGNPAGGTFSGNGVIGDTFDPTLATIGNNPITYTYTDANGCKGTTSANVLVNQQPVAKVGPDTTVCANAGSFLLQGSPTGGTWSGNGVEANGTFTPAASLIGDQVLTYVVDVSGCSLSTAKRKITVKASPVFTFTPVLASTTVGVPISFLPSDSTFAGYSWDFGDSAISLKAKPVHVYKHEGEYTVQLTATNAAGCSETFSSKVTVEDQQVYVPNIFSPMAQNEENQRVKVYGSGFLAADFEFRIYNRWGGVVYETNDFEAAHISGWDGIEVLSGKEQQAGVYTYVLKGLLENGQAFRKTGSITLVR
jgi:PKD repeat protein